MKRLLIIVIILVVPALTGLGQSSLERKALNSMSKAKWDKARGQLHKALRKDPANTAATYVKSLYFFNAVNPAFQVDSSYRYVMDAMEMYGSSNPKQRERLKRFPVDSAILVNLRKQIDSAAFERAKLLNTERSYIDFIERFPLAAQQGRAKELRDEVAFIDALKENTYESFLGYLNKYPTASRAGEARERFEKLLFEAKTRDRRLASYETFLEEYPNTPYRHLAEAQIFEISTASGKPETFLDFIRRFPESRLKAKAGNILYYLLVEEERAVPSFLLTDSIRLVRELEQGYLVPFLKEGRFGFMNARGTEVISAFAEEIDPFYLCGNITEDLLVAGGKVLARNGSVLLSAEGVALDDLGHGFVFAEGKDCSWLLHKSGFLIDECIDDARVLGGTHLAIQKNDKWTLKTLTGRPLPVEDFDDVAAIDEVLAFRRLGKFRLIRSEDIARAADHIEPVMSAPFDEVRRWGTSMIWVRAGELQGLLDMQLNEELPLGRREMQPAFFGAVSRLPDGSSLWNARAGQSEVFREVRVQKPWVVARKNEQWFMLDELTFHPIGSTSFDTVYFVGAFGMCLRGDSLRAYYTPYDFIPVPSRASLQFLPGRDSTFYLLIEEADRKTVYDHAGKKLFTANYDRIEFAGEDLFLAVRKEKRGLINAQGRPVVPLDYDAMGTLQNGSVPVLKDRKFGFVDVINRKEIKPVYEKNLVRYNLQYLVASKGGLQGIIDWNNKNITPFEYEEVVYWSDSSALVKKNFQWSIYNFVEKKVIADKIRNFKWLSDTDAEKLIIVNREGNHGVVSNRKGYVLAPTYSDIVNIGSKTQPLYFTEKHVEEASIYVVIYYDDQGQLLRRQVFEIEDYERIYCSDN